MRIALFDHTRGAKIVFARALNYVRTIVLGVNAGRVR